MGGFFQWVTDPSVNPTWGTGSYPESGQNILGSNSGLGPDWWGFPGGQWGPNGFEIPWNVLPPGADDPWWGTDIGQAIYEMVYGMPWGTGGQGPTVGGPTTPPGATPVPVDPNLQPPAVEDVMPIPPQLADPEQGEVPQYQDAVQMPQPADPGAGIDIPWLPIGAGGMGAALGAIIAAGGAQPPGDYPATVDWSPTQPAGNPQDVPPVYTPDTGVPTYEGGTTQLPLPDAPPILPPPPIPTIPTPPPVSLDPVPVPSTPPTTLDPTPGTPGTPNPSTPDVPLPQLPTGGVGIGDGAPLGMSNFPMVGAPKNLQSLFAVPPASAQGQLPSLGALLASMMR